MNKPLRTGEGQIQKDDVNRRTPDPSITYRVEGVSFCPKSRFITAEVQNTGQVVEHIPDRYIRFVERWCALGHVGQPDIPVGTGPAYGSVCLIHLCFLSSSLSWKLKRSLQLHFPGADDE